MSQESRTASLYQITKELLQAYNRFPRKNLGQHFLVDPKVVERIIAAARLTKDDLVIEIGSGLGVVTAEIAAQAGHIIAVEIDKELVAISKQVLKDFNNVSFIAKDILKLELNRLTTNDTDLVTATNRRFKIIGNLPYYITAPIIEKILTAEQKPELAVIMVQKEVAERMAANPGSKKYGSFSIFCQYHAKVELSSLVSKSSFLPWPEVGSAIVTLTPHPQPLFPGLDEQKFFQIVHTAFQQRRKMLRNSLKEFNLENCGIDLNRRPEELEIEEFIALSLPLNVPPLHRSP